MMTDLRVLVTGASGFVGCALCTELANRSLHECAISRRQDVSPDLSATVLAHGAGARARLIRLLQSAGALLGKRGAVQRLYASLCADITKARQGLGWTPSITVDDGLRRVMQEYAQP